MMQDKENKPFWTVGELAQRYQLSEKTIYKLKIMRTKIGGSIRFPADAVTRYEKRQQRLA